MPTTAVCRDWVIWYLRTISGIGGNIFKSIHPNLNNVD